MRVFVTGATGFIGSAIVQDLIQAGHRVVGLARNDAAVDTLARWGVEAHRGDLMDPVSVAAGAQTCDGVIHTAFIHDFAAIAASGRTDKIAIEVLGGALANSDRPLVIASGIAVVKPGHLATEAEAGDSGSAGKHRVPSEDTALALASRGVRACVVRLAPSVHGDGDHGFIPALIDTARQKGVSAYVGDGLNRWPAVHRLDAARLFRLALEKGTAGARYHGVADEGVPVRDIAAVIGRRVNLPVVSKSPAEAAAHFGWLGHFVAADCPATSALTQRTLGWRPVQPGLIADLDRPRYFEM